jgi:hypothetical protein
MITDNTTNLAVWVVGVPVIKFALSIRLVIASHVNHQMDVATE